MNESNRLSGFGKYAFKEINDRVAKMRESGVKVIDFGVGDPSEPTPDFVIEALTEGARKHASTGYPNYTGSKDYLQACAEYMQRRFAVKLDSETEICSNIGSKEAIFNFPEAFVNPGDYVLVPSPGYPPMKTGTTFAEGTNYFVPLLAENDWLIDYESIPDEIVAKAKILWLNYPNSPTGAIASREYYEGLIKWANDNDIILAADEGCYIDMYFDEKPISILEVARKGVVTFYSLSKRNNMTGYRAGFVAGDAELIATFKKLKTNVDSGTPNFVQEAAIAALKDDEHVEYMRDLYKKKRDILLKALGSDDVPAATFYVWHKCPDGDDIEFAKKLIDLGIVVTPGSLISDECEGGINPGDGYVRFALMPTMEEMEEAAKRITEGL